MATDKENRGNQMLAAILRFLKIFTVNTWRRLLMGGHYLIIGFHQLRLRRVCRILGQRVLAALAGGEVNPMLAGEVKDSLDRAQALQKVKEKHYQGIAALREKIQAAKAGEPPPPEPEAAPQ